MLARFFTDTFTVSKLTEAVVSHINKRTYTLQPQAHKGKLVALSQTKTLMIDKIQVSAQWKLYTGYSVPVAIRDQVQVSGVSYEVLQVIPDAVKHNHLELLLKTASDLRTT
jgi:SPP1 family predicted phage head-tail adaptor